MQKVPTARLFPALLLSWFLPITACDAPQAGDVPTAPRLARLSGATLIHCPTSQSKAAERRLLPPGGIVVLDRHEVIVPLGALRRIADIGIQVPVSRHMRVDLTVNDQEHWQFHKLVTVTIDYSRCSDEALGRNPLSVWHIDSRTGELLEEMGSVDDRLLKQITFVTDHFSGYAIAN
ncbi:MAG TPA: hypothetical protein VMN78_11665 [Longimicrobiales bacterium]|nr:hypothetical protein [Longimicrobiales bacterium]